MPTRADLLAWGAVLAALVRLPNGITIIRRLLWPALLGASLIVVAVIVRFGSSYYWSPSMAVAGYPAIAVSATCLVAIAIVYNPPALRLSWLTRIGKVSYSLYLWHTTAIAVLAQLLSHMSAWLIPLALLLSLVPTLLSWYLIERPALSLKRFAPMRAPRRRPEAPLVESGLVAERLNEDHGHQPAMLPVDGIVDTPPMRGS